MSSNFKAPYLLPEQIEEKSADFLTKYNPQDVIPVPIDKIIEGILGLDIIPIPGLTKDCDVDGFISSDFKSISVDQDMFEDKEHRYRFTLAHEIGHMFLHQMTYKALKIGSLSKYQSTINSLNPKQYGFFEYHAYQFGGYILVPKSHLGKSFKSAVQRIKDDGRLDLTVTENIELAWDFISRRLQDTFNVSAGVISRCIARDNLFI